MRSFSKEFLYVINVSKRDVSFQMFWKLNVIWVKTIEGKRVKTVNHREASSQLVASVPKVIFQLRNYKSTTDNLTYGWGRELLCRIKQLATRAIMVNCCYAH